MMQDPLNDFDQSLRALQDTLDRLDQAIYLYLTGEGRMVEALRAWVEEQGGALRGVMVSIALDGIGEEEGWVRVSAKGKAWPRTIEEFVEGILQNPLARAGLRAKGVGERVWPVVFALAADDRALEAARAAGVGLLLGGQGMVVPPVPWSLEAGAPLGR